VDPYLAPDSDAVTLLVLAPQTYSVFPAVTSMPVPRALPIGWSTE